MVTHLFRDFLAYPDQYAGAERFWSTLVQDVAKANDQPNEWASWIPRTYGDGTPMPPDGNPIFDARSERLSRAIRIMQHAPFRHDVEISAWVSHHDYSEVDGPGPTDELNIGCALSEESASIARALIDLWMRPATTFDQMKEAIDVALTDVE